jgi:hypothetical protein
LLLPALWPDGGVCRWCPAFHQHHRFVFHGHWRCGQGAGPDDPARKRRCRLMMPTCRTAASRGRVGPHGPLEFPGGPASQFYCQGEGALLVCPLEGGLAALGHGRPRGRGQERRRVPHCRCVCVGGVHLWVQAGSAQWPQSQRHTHGSGFGAAALCVSGGIGRPLILLVRAGRAAGAEAASAL